MCVVCEVHVGWLNNHTHLDLVNLVGNLCPEIIDNLIELVQCKRLQLLLRVIEEGQDATCDGGVQHVKKEQKGRNK